MIELKVQDYCENCKGFSPEVHSETVYTDGHEFLVQTTVTCKYEAKCNSLVRYLTKQINKKEK